MIGHSSETKVASLIVYCLDGPLKGETFTVGRCPRVVACVRSSLDGQADILNEPDDAPRLDEEVHWYRWDGSPAGHLCTRGRGCFAAVGLVHTPNVRDLRAPAPVNPGAVPTERKEAPGA